MYVIIALILLVIFGIRVGADKMSSKATDNRLEAKFAYKDAWVNAVTDRKLERDMNLYFNDPKNEREIDAKVLEVFKEIPECRNLTSANIFDSGSKNLNRRIKFLIMMAKNGKLPWDDVYIYITLPYYSRATMEHIKKIERYIAVVKWADAQVFTMPNAPKLVFEQTFHVGPHCNVDEAWDRYSYDGHLTWFPIK